MAVLSRAEPPAAPRPADGRDRPDGPDAADGTRGPRGRRGRAAPSAAAVALALTAMTVPAAVAAPAPAAPASAPARTAVDGAELDATLDAVHEAGIYGIFSAVRDGRAEWRGASGTADVRTGREVRPDHEQRVGSITKTFVSVAVLQQVAEGRIDLDAPIGKYLPDLVPGERGRRVTVRMLLNHTSGISDHIVAVFPSLAEGSPRSLDDNRHRHFAPEDLARAGLRLPATGEPGEKHVYANTNYVLAGLLLRRVTGESPERHITRHVIRKAGLRHTYFPRTSRLTGPHPRMYESLYGLIDPPRDYSDYDMSWVGTAGSLVSTTRDLNRFYRLLLDGRLLPDAQLAEMKRTVPVTDGQGRTVMNYGLGLYRLDTLPCGPVWGHDGMVFGAGTMALSSEDGHRQVALAFNLSKYQRLTEDGQVERHPADTALDAHLARALCGTADTGTGKAGAGAAARKAAAPGPSLPLTLHAVPYAPAG